MINRIRFGYIPMKKKSKTIKKTTAELSELFAENCKIIFENLLKNGFSTEEALKILLAVINRGS